MPRISKRVPRQRRVLTPQQFYGLMAWDYFRDWMTPDGRDDTAARRAAWEEHGEDLTRLHSEHYPGTRPQPWWTYDAPEGGQRRRVDGKPHPFEDGSIPPERQRLFFGLPACIQTPDHFDAVYETQRMFLQRHRLLTASERRRLQAEASRAALAVEDDAPQLTPDQIEVWYEATR
jgi:hypothetical protein